MKISNNLVLFFCLLSITLPLNLGQNLLSKKFMLGKYLDPLDLNPVTSKMKKLKFRQIIFTSNLKDLIEGIYEGYTNLSLKRHLTPKEFYDEVKRFNFDNDLRLDSITCDNLKDSNLEYGKGIQKLYLIMHSLDTNNYKSFLEKLLTQIQKLAQSIGNNCSNIMDYIMYFKDQADENNYLLQTGYHDPWLFAQLHSCIHRFFYNLGNFRKMGNYIGHILVWYKVYDPKNAKLLINKASIKKKIHLLKNFRTQKYKGFN